MNNGSLSKLCKLIRHHILTSTTAAQSGHPSSSLSAVELMTTLFFGSYLHYDLDNPKNPANDRVIFSKGHASPLLYSLYAAVGVISQEELLKLRTFDSPLEGHPSVRLPYVDVATGSLGQGLSVGIGMCLGTKLKIQSEKLKIEREPRVFVLLGDSEFSEGQIWEALQIASYYKLNNLIGILDVNRLGQRGETMVGWDVETYAKRIKSFGWKTMIVNDANDISQVYKAFSKLDRLNPPASQVELVETLRAGQSKSVKSVHTDSTDLTDLTDNRPTMIIAKTIKGKGVSIMEDKEGWHGKPLSQEQLNEALKELGEVDLKLKGEIKTVLNQPSDSEGQLESVNTKKEDANFNQFQPISTDYNLGNLISTRDAYGDCLVELGKQHEDLLVLDAELSNSTKTDKFKEVYPERFFEMFIAEQNMVSTAVGLSAMGFQTFSSTFASFFTRAFDQVRMGYYSRANIRLVGSHSGVFMGKDGPSQMGLEDFAMMRSIQESVVLSPADGISAFKLTQKMYETKGVIYMRTMRDKLPVLYSPDEEFPIGGSKILKHSEKDTAVIFATGVTVHEALKAYDQLQKEGINIAIVDCYSIKPLDIPTLQLVTRNSQLVIVAEDHYPYGGLGEAIVKEITNSKLQIPNFAHLCVKKMPRSGTPEELLRYEEIDAEAIVNAVQNLQK